MAEILLGNVKGPAGAQGAGVPLGGTAGQVLAKKSNANNDTQWVTPSGGSADLSTPWQNASIVFEDISDNSDVTFLYRRTKTGLIQLYVSGIIGSSSVSSSANVPRMLVPIGSFPVVLVVEEEPENGVIYLNENYSESSIYVDIFVSYAGGYYTGYVVYEPKYLD